MEERISYVNFAYGASEILAPRHGYVRQQSDHREAMLNESCCNDCCERQFRSQHHCQLQSSESCSQARYVVADRSYRITANLFLEPNAKPSHEFERGEVDEDEMRVWEA